MPYVGNTAGKDVARGLLAPRDALSLPIDGAFRGAAR